MIAGWISSDTVVSRIYRNIKGIDSSYNEDIVEWIVEALLKMKTDYALEVRPCKIEVVNHQARLPCRIEGLKMIAFNGHKLQYFDGHDYRSFPPNEEGTIFKSLNPIYTSSGDISAGDEGRSKFPTDVIIPWDMPCSPDAWYKVNGRYLQTSIKEGTLTAWVQDMPRDNDNYPLLPDNEYVQEAIYRYCRMMLIESGYEDKVFTYAHAEAAWNKAALTAINDMSYPSPDQVEMRVHKYIDDHFPDGMYTSYLF